MNTLEKLRAIPDLATLAGSFAATPYRAPRGPEKYTGRGMSSGPVPTELLASDMLSTVGLLAELTLAVRMVWEQQEGDRLVPNDPTTFAGECSWLIRTSDVWQADPVMHKYVRGKVNRVHRELARWVGVAPAQRLVCAKCGGPVHVDDYSATGDGQKAAACSDCGTVWTPGDIATGVVMNTPSRLPEVARLTGVNLRKLQRLAKAGLLKPVTTHSPAPNTPALYLPSAAAALADVVKDDPIPTEEGQPA